MMMALASFTVWGVGKDLRGATAGYVFSGGELIGIFSLSDTCRAGVAEALEELHRMRIRTAMLTGDITAAAMTAQQQVSEDSFSVPLVLLFRRSLHFLLLRQLGNTLCEIYAELLPEDKVRIIKDLRTKKGRVVMVGDGINDAPAMVAADVGISMGISGSAVAMETSHVTLMSNDVRKIPAAILLGRRTSRKIIENIFLSVATKSAILALALSGHPFLWAAVVADVGTCLLVIFNSMLLLKSPPGRRSHAHDQKKCSDHHAHDHEHHHHVHHPEIGHSSNDGRHHEHDHVRRHEIDHPSIHSHRHEHEHGYQESCPCGDFHKRLLKGGSCRSHQDGATAGLPQLTEIVAE